MALDQSPSRFDINELSETAHWEVSGRNIFVFEFDDL